MAIQEALVYEEQMPTQEELEKYLQKERRRIEERGI